MLNKCFQVDRYSAGDLLFAVNMMQGECRRAGLCLHFSCLLRPRPFAADGIHMLNICLNCLPTTDKHNTPDYIMQMSSNC